MVSVVMFGGTTARLARGAAGRRCRWIGGAWLGLIGGSLLRPAPTSAQTDTLAQAAATITAAEMAQDVAALMADSLRGRPTPSPALERTAQYLAAAFERLGLRPGVPAHRADGGDSTWFQRYPLPGQQRFDYTRSYVVLTASGRADLRLGFTTDVRFLPALGPPVVVENVLNGGRDYFSADWIRMGSAQVVLVAGPQTVVTLAAHDFHDQVVLYVPPATLDSAAMAPVLATLYARSAGVVVVRGSSNERRTTNASAADSSMADSAAFVAAAAVASRRPLPVVDGYLRDAQGPRRWPWAVAVRAGAVTPWLTMSGIDLAALRTDSIPRIQAIPNAAVWLDPQADSTAATAATTVPNVLGWLEGTDSLLKQQYVVVSTHMDGGIPAGASDAAGHSIDDNAVGVAGLLALARAWSAPGIRPKRSILFIATSGTGPGQTFWGSNVAASYDQRFWGFTLKGRALVANLTLDQLGQMRGDTVLINGLSDMDPPVSAAWMAVEHPELGLRVVEARTAAVPTGDQFAFVRHNVPSLYIHARAHDVTGDPADATVSMRESPATAVAAARPTTLALDGAARILRFVFYLGQALATAQAAPSWNAEGRRQFLAQQSSP